MGGDAMSGGAWSRDCVARIEALESETERLLRRVARLAEILKRVEGFGARLPSNLLDDVRAVLAEESR
jgi:hypothetical protein